MCQAASSGGQGPTVACQEVAILVLYTLQLFVQAWAKGTSYEACVEGTAGPDDGTVLRAPTEKQGLIPLCKDTFLGKVRIRLRMPPTVATAVTSESL